MSVRSLRVRSLVAVALAGALGAACASGPEAPPPIAMYRPLAPGTCAAFKGQPIDRVCIPRAAREGAPLALEISQPCGACSTAESCSVTIVDRTIALSLDGQVCEPPEAACTRACESRRVACRIPPLDAGRWIVRWADGSGRVDTLEVTPDPRAATTCSLAAAPPT